MDVRGEMACQAAGIIALSWTIGHLLLDRTIDSPCSPLPIAAGWHGGCSSYLLLFRKGIAGLAAGMGVFLLEAGG